MRTLIVDDDETICRLLAEILEHAGIEATWVAESLAGYDLALQHPYDLFILDVYMPSLSGPEFAERLKKAKPAAQVILISAFADESLRETARGLGVALLSKPFSRDCLLAAVAQVRGQQA